MIQGAAIGPTVRVGLGHTRTSSCAHVRSTTRNARPLWTRSSSAAGTTAKRCYRRTRPGTHAVAIPHSTRDASLQSTPAFNHDLRIGTDTTQFSVRSTSSRSFSTSSVKEASSRSSSGSSKGKPKLIDGEVVYQRKGGKIVPVMKNPATPGVSPLFLEMTKILEKETSKPLGAPTMGLDKSELPLEEEDNTLYLSELDPSEMVPSDFILSQVLEKENLKLKRDDIINLIRPVVEVLPAEEKNPERVKIEQKFLKACKSMGLRPDILAEWCFNFTKAGAPLALTIYRLSMEQGEIVSSYSYAALLYRGAKGVPADKVRGRAILESLANVNKKATINKNGFAPAMAAMGGIYARDDGNMEMAEKYYVRAAQCGVPDAQLALGRMYLNGELPYNPSKAKLYLQVAAENDRATDKANAETHFMLGSLEQRMGKPDVKRAFQHFQKAASKGLPEAQYNVGQSYFVGMGVPKNDALAVEYWKMSAQQGFGLAQLSLGAYYFQDEVPQEQTIPGSEASAGGDKPATTKHVWDSSKKDLLQAQKWFTLASRRSGDLGLEGKRLRGKVEEAMRKGKGARDGKCTIM